MRFLCLVLFTILLAAASGAADASSLPPEEADAVAPAAGDSQPADAAGAAAKPAAAGDSLKSILKNLKVKADKGDPEAQETLGRMYFDGLVVPRNYGAAAQWYYRAAQQGNSNSQGMLSKFYMEGTGVPQSYTKAYFWFMLSLDPRDEEWQDKHDEIAQYLNADQMAEQDKILSEWRPSAAKPEENAEAQAASAECTALEIFKTVPYPKTESTRCKDSYKKTNDICHESCGACEAAMDKFRDVCAGVLTAQESVRGWSFCSQDSDCILIETDCRKDYSPIAVNARTALAVRRSHGYPEDDCRRSTEDKEKQNGYSAACNNKSCEVKRQ